MKDCFEVVWKYIEKSRYIEAIATFHLALFCLVKMRFIIDAYVIKAFLIKKKKSLSIPNLCQTIDAQFSSLLMRNNFDAYI